MNIDRFKTIVDRIRADPRCWDQTQYHACSTVHCIAGHAQLDARRHYNRHTDVEDQDGPDVEHEACIWLEFSDEENLKARWLFHADRSLKDFEAVLKYGLIEASITIPISRNSR
jgi:hypothetical protein